MSLCTSERFGWFAFGFSAVAAIHFVDSTFFPFGSFSKSILFPLVSKYLTSSSTQKLFWSIGKYSRRPLVPEYFRSQVSDPKCCLVFIAADDPHSFMLLQSLVELRKAHKNLFVRIVVLQPGLHTWATSVEDQVSWALADSIDFARLYGLLEPTVSLNCTDKDALERVTVKLLGQLSEMYAPDADKNWQLVVDEALDVAIETLKEIYSTSDRHSAKVRFLPMSSEDIAKQLSRNSDLLNDVGHYGPGVVEVEGEIYQLSRLHHLERRLLGNDPSDDTNVFFCRELEKLGRKRTDSSSSPCSSLTFLETTLLSKEKHVNFSCPQVTLYYSFRSPYSQLAVKRIRRLCAHYNAKCILKIMMPMVMRGLPVPFSKVKFFITDCAREARLWNIDMGYSCDPIKPEGKPVMRALDCFVIAKWLGKEWDFVEAFSELVWGHGVDAGTDRGLRQVVERAGMTWRQVQSAIGAPEIEAVWRELTDRHRSEILTHGLWGVPCFSVTAHVGSGSEVVKTQELLFTWGQDKIWQVERVLQEIKMS